MEILNFTQFCIKHGYPCDNDTMFQAQLLGSRGLAGSISKRTISKQDDSFHKMQSENKKAHALFYEAIKNGSLIDGSGELTQENILQREKRMSDEKIKSTLEGLKGKIRFIESLGGMSHMKNGNLRKNYQMQVNEYNLQIEQLLSE